MAALRGPKGSQISSKKRFFQGFKTNEKTNEFRGEGVGTAAEELDLWEPGGRQERGIIKG